MLISFLFALLKILYMALLPLFVVLRILQLLFQRRLSLQLLYSFLFFFNKSFSSHQKIRRTNCIVVCLNSAILLKSSQNIIVTCTRVDTTFQTLTQSLSFVYRSFVEISSLISILEYWNFQWNLITWNILEISKYLT